MQQHAQSSLPAILDPIRFAYQQHILRSVTPLVQQTKMHKETESFVLKELEVSRFNFANKLTMLKLVSEVTHGNQVNYQQILKVIFDERIQFSFDPQPTGTIQ